MNGLTAGGLIAACVALAPGCCLLGGHRTPEGVEKWQDTTPPSLSLARKAERYQERIDVRFQTPEGVLRYRRPTSGVEERSYGDLADGCFHTGIYLASQALRFAATKEPRARVEALRSLKGLGLLMEVTGKRGLLARHISPAGTIGEESWLPSRTRPGYVWRSDVSKDQYAGFIHGLGVALALMGDDPEVRVEVARLSAAAADHLIENDMGIVDVTGLRTTHGDLSGRIAFVPIGVNALISLAIARVAAASTGEPRHEAFHRRLVEEGYADIAYWAYFSVLGVGNRVNDNMGYLALYPLLLLENDPVVLEKLRESEWRTWGHVSEDRNAFFSFVHAALVGDAPEPGGSPAESAPRLPSEEGIRAGLESLREFPEEKVEWPVDLTRPGFDFPRAFLNSRACAPRTTRGVPLYLRARTSSFWASDPYRLVARLGRRGEVENAGMDYLLAYWMGRYHGFVSPEE
jgi:hypothetical protein